MNFIKRIIYLSQSIPAFECKIRSTFFWTNTNKGHNENLIALRLFAEFVWNGIEKHL